MALREGGKYGSSSRMTARSRREGSGTKFHRAFRYVALEGWVHLRNILGEGQTVTKVMRKRAMERRWRSGSRTTEIVISAFCLSLVSYSPFSC